MTTFGQTRQEFNSKFVGARTPGEGDARPLVAAPTGDDTLGDADEELPVPPRTNDRP